MSSIKYIAQGKGHLCLQPGRWCSAPMEASSPRWVAREELELQGLSFNDSFETKHPLELLLKVQDGETNVKTEGQSK